MRAKTECNAARHYNGFRPPTCNHNHPCDACIDKFVLTKLEQIMHNELHDDPMLVRQVAGQVVEVLGKRQP